MMMMMMMKQEPLAPAREFPGKDTTESMCKRTAHENNSHKSKKKTGRIA